MNTLCSRFEVQKCRVCSESKPYSMFDKHVEHHSGYDTMCKDCRREYYRRYYEKKKEHIRAKVKSYAKTEKGKVVKIKSAKRTIAKYPKKQKARNILNNAIMTGRVKKASSCLVVECLTTRLEAHHNDYSKPLEVLWLCSLHHKELHKKI